MDDPPAPSFDPALLDMENMTAEKWFALIYNRTVQQEDIFVGDLKKKVIEIINTCMNKPNTTLENIQQDLIKTINESQFEFEHQKFIDGIVGGAYEYLCQFIIKNSMENIKRTQCALNCFSLTNNFNYSPIKPCCNENILLQGSSKLTQMQCLPESNNNTTDSDKAIQSYIFNNNSENCVNSILMVESEDIKNSTVNKTEDTSFHNYRPALQINNLSVESTTTSLDNPYNDDSVNTNNASVIIDDDEKTTEAIISLAMKIQQTNFNFVDDFEADDINVSNVCTSNEVQTTKCLIEQNGDQNTDPLKLEEEYKIHNSLKLLESLVNIEHDKLEVQKSLTENEIQQIETNEKMQFKSSKKANTRKKKSQKLLENIHKEEEEEWLPTAKKQKNHCSKNKNKANKSKSHKDKTSKKKRKLEVQNTLNNLSTSNSSCSVENHSDESTSMALNGSLFSSYTKKPETIVSTVQKTKLLDTTSCVGSQLAKTKSCLPTIEFKQVSDIVEKMPQDGKKNCLAVTDSNSNALLIKNCSVASSSGYNEKDIDSLKNKSSNLSSSVMKTSDYKKLYEKDRKSLFSPDVVVIKNAPSKPSKDSANDLHVKKKHSLIQKKEDQDKKPKSEIKEESNNKTSDDGKKLSKDKVKITNNKLKTKNDSKSKPNNASTSLEQKSLFATPNNKFKRFKVTKSNDESKTYADSSTNNESNTTDLLENKVSDNIDTLKSQEFDRTNILENKYGEGTSKQQQFGRVYICNDSNNSNSEHLKSNGTNALKNKEPFKDPLFDENMPEWLRKKCVLFKLKPCYVLLKRLGQ